jgi:hypothetical protein
MNQFNPLTLGLISNSILLISLTVTQNESSKESAVSQNSSVTNPFEILTWIAVIFQLLFLLITQKITDF